MNKRLAAIILLVFAAAGVSSASVILDKVPNLGPFWSPLSSTGSYVYADSFVLAGGSDSLLTKLGVYMELLDVGTPGSEFRFELLADSAGSPDPTAVLGQTASLQATNTSLALVTASLLGPVRLTLGTRYWIAVSTVGLGGVGSYQVGGHTQNSIYNDNGTFWFSNDPTGLTWDAFNGEGRTPEMAIYAEGSPVPEPGTCLALFAGLIALAVLRRKSA